LEEDNNIKNFSAADIERYHKGLMSSKEMHALEKAAMDDPFLADALEGYSITGVKVKNDLDDLRNRLANRTGSKKIVAMPGKRYYWMKVAAMIIVIAGAGMLAYSLLNRRENSVAQNKKEQTNEGTVQVTDSAQRSNSFLKTDTLQGSGNNVADRNNHSIPADTDKLQGLETSVNSPRQFRRDSAGFSAANTTKDLASGDLVTIPPSVANNSAPVAIDEKKEGAKQKDSLVIIAQDKKYNKPIEDFALKEVIVSKREDAAFDKASLAKKSAQPLGVNRKLSDSMSYGYNGALNVFRGRVTDASNNGISFANVTVNNVNVGTYADAKGYFSLVAPDSVINVNLRAVGFNNSQVQLRNNLPTNQVVMQEDKSIDAIVMSNKKPNTKRSRTADMVLTEPEPNDGWEKYDDYLANNLKPPEARGDIQKKSGEVELSFDINNNGEPVNIRVTKSLCKECDEEAIRLVKEGPKWKKKKRKEKARVTITF
jgi:TonB family protein